MTSQTLSHWLKIALADAKIDTSVFSGHSFRGAATSKAVRQGVSIDLVFKQAGWTTAGVFGKYYNREVGPDQSLFQNTILHK